MQSGIRNEGGTFPSPRGDEGSATIEDGILVKEDKMGFRPLAGMRAQQLSCLH